MTTDDGEVLALELFERSHEPSFSDDAAGMAEAREWADSILERFARQPQPHVVRCSGGEESGVDWANGLVLHEGDDGWHPWDETIYGARPATQPTTSEPTEDKNAAVVAQIRRYLERFGPGDMHAHQVMKEAIESILDGAKVAWAPSDATQPTTSEPTDSEVEAATSSLEEHKLGTTWGDDGITFVGCDCGEWFGKAIEGAWDRAREHQVLAALRAARGVRP